jgi:class 3 adenylate cyclase/predicted ATPase
MPVFMFTDIEGSTGLWERHQGAMGPIIARHYDILELVVNSGAGKIIKKTGDGIFALFPDEIPARPSTALQCALDLQRAFQGEAWPLIGELRVRIALHSGQAEEMGGDYYGPTANRTARLMSLAWGGQILISEDLYKQATLPLGARAVDLGLHQVKDLPEPQQVYGLLHPDLKLQEFPPLKSLSNRPHNLPEQLSPLVGRNRELRDLGMLLTGTHTRLITLLGGGGMGKSRLAIEAALENLGAFKHGINRVSLAALAQPDELPLRIAESLKLATYRQKDPKAQVLEYLKEKELLLILDPCEHLVGGGGWISDLMEACPGLRVLACSRRRLELRGSAVLDVRGLDYPAEVAPEGFSSVACVRFFVQEVQGFQAGYSLKPEDRPYFLRVCQALGGMPLGLELAAGWLRVLPMKALAERLELDPRFLSSNRQDLPVSHRSLQALFDSSWELLAEPERALLAQLTVFSGSFTPAAARLAFKASPEALAALADSCLLDSAQGGRYDISATARSFAATKLEADPARLEQALDLHARYFCRLLRERERNLLGYDQVKAVVELRQELPNLQRAWDRALDKGWAREIAQAARCLGLYTDMQGLGRDWEGRMDKALKFWERPHGAGLEGLSPEESLTAQASLLANAANYLFSFGKGAAALAGMEKSLALSRKASHRAGAAYALVRIAVFMGPEDERRRPALEEAAKLYQALNDANGLAWARRHLGYLYCLQGHGAEGKPLLEESLAVFRKFGNQREIGWSLNSLGQLALETGQAEAGAQGLREARDIFLALGDRETAAWTLNRLGRAAIKAGHWDEARAALEESLALFGQVRDFRGRTQAMRSLCDLCAGQGDLGMAFQILDKAVAEALAAGDLGGQAGALMQKGQLLASQERFKEALALMQEAQAVFVKAGSEQGQALALEGQACAVQRQGDGGLARRYFEEASRIFGRAGMHEGEARACVRLGDLDASEGKIQGGEASYKRALRLSRQNKPGDYSLGALLGLSALFHKQGRKLEALHLVLACERAQAAGILPASEPEFSADVQRRTTALLGQIGGKLLQSVVDEARGKLAKEDARALLKECVEKNWS